MIKKYFSAFLILLSALFPASTRAEQPESLTLKNITVKQLQQIYKKYGYEHHIATPSGQIPPIYLEHFPSDYANLPDSDERNKLFIRILTPLALRLNQEIMSERGEMLRLKEQYQKQKKLSDNEQAQLENLAKKYDVFTRMKGNERTNLLFNQLEIKINQVYPSFLISIAAVETDWGTSRIVREGNSLYKELVWHTPEGLEPQDETEDHTYRIRIFPNLYESMKSFALKFNSSVSYEHARFLRNLRHRSGILPSGKSIVHSMLFQSPLQNYIGILDYTITFYELMLLDQAPLASSLPPPENQP